TNYANILTERQKIALEERKTQIQSENEQAKWERDQKASLARYFVEKGDGVTANRIMASDSLQGAYVIADERDGTLSQNLALRSADVALGVVDKIENLLTAPGLRGAVGPNILSRGFLGTPSTEIGEGGNYLAALDA